MKRFIIFLIRKRLGLKKNELFRFANQCEQSVYYFTETGLMKVKYGHVMPSGVSLSWLLDDECEVERVTRYDYENKEKMEHWKQEVAEEMSNGQRYHPENPATEELR